MPVRREFQQAAVGNNGASTLRVAHIPNRDVLHGVGQRRQMRGAQKQLTRRHFVDHLLTKRERRFYARNIVRERGQSVVRPREHLVVEPHHEQRDDCAGNDDGNHQPLHREAARLECGNLVLGGHPAKGVQRGHEHGHRHGHRDGERHGEDQELRDNRPVQSLTHELPQLLGDVLQQQ